MGQRVVCGPVREGRPADRIMGSQRVAVEEVLEDRRRSVRVVVGAVDERIGRSVGAPGSAAMGAAAEELEGADVVVHVGQAGGLGVGSVAARGRAGRVQFDLRVGRAAAGGDEAEAGRRIRLAGRAERQPAGGGSPQRPVGGDVAKLEGAGGRDDLPLGRGARIRRRTDRAEQPGGEEVAVLAVEEVLAERRRLHPERLGGAGRRRGDVVAEAGLPDERSRRARLQRVAALADRVAIDRALSGRRRRDEQRDDRDQRHEDAPSDPIPWPDHSSTSLRRP